MNEVLFTFGFDALEFIVFVIFASAIIIPNVRKYRNFKKRAAYDEKCLAEAGFKISRIIGRSEALRDIINSYNPYTVYFDDINRKWAFSDPSLMMISKIRDFSDLAQYSFFDEDGKDKGSKSFSLLVSFAGLIIGAVAGIEIGAAVSPFGEAIGIAACAAIGAAGFFFVSYKLLNLKGASGKFGLKIKTKDCDESKPYLVLDFVNIRQKPSAMLKYKNCELGFIPLESDFVHKKSGEIRASEFYKANMETIDQLKLAFDAIISQNAKNRTAYLSEQEIIV
jgi:hypothetical protein